MSSFFLKRPSNEVTQACINLNASFASSYIELHIIKAAIIYLTVLMIYLLLLMNYLFLLIIYLPLLTIYLILYWLCICPQPVPTDCLAASWSADHLQYQSSLIIYLQPLFINLPIP